MNDTYPEWAAWMRQQGYAAETARAYQATVRRWKRSRMPATDWLLRENAKGQTRGGPPTASARIYRRALVAWCRWSGEPAPAPLPRVIRLAQPRPASILSLAQVIRIDAEIEQLPEPYAVLLGLLRATGLRVSEACTARLDGLRRLGSILVLDVTAKTTAQRIGTRTVVIPQHFQAQLVAHLRGWRAGRGDSAWLFPSPRGTKTRARPISVDAVREHCVEIGERLGLRLHPHAFRHRFATELVEAGIEMRVIAEALGHHMASMTGRYTHPSIEVVADAVERAAAEQARQRALLLR